MPRYNYLCALCGPFEEMREAAVFDQPCACPACGTASPRQLSVAQIARRGPFASKDVKTAFGGHGGGCACCGPAGGKGFRAEVA